MSEPIKADGLVIQEVDMSYHTLDVDKVQTLDDVKDILRAMDLQIRDDGSLSLLRCVGCTKTLPPKRNWRRGE